MGLPKKPMHVGLLVADYPDWKRIRTTVSPTFSLSKIKQVCLFNYIILVILVNSRVDSVIVLVGVETLGEQPSMQIRSNGAMCLLQPAQDPIFRFLER